jgi:dolichyl-diphosphooligosaccharide--protein glycosyltransferase
VRTLRLLHESSKSLNLRNVHKNGDSHARALTARIIKHLINLFRRGDSKTGTKEFLSREGFVNGLKSLGKLRIKVSHTSVLTFSALAIILFVAFTVRVLPIRWEIQVGAVHLSEFDPYYYYSIANYMVKNGLISPYWPTQWVDPQRWYPFGLNMGQSLSSLPMTAAFLYDILAALGVQINLMVVCAFIPPIFGMLTALIIYLIGKDVGGKAVGMLAALFLALNSSIITRNNLGFFKPETVGLISIPLFIFLFLRAIERDRAINSAVMYSLCSGATLAYMIMGWGGAYYLVDLTVLFFFFLFALRRYTRRLLLVYSLTFGLGLSIAMINPYINVGYIANNVILPVAGVFVLLCLNEVVRASTSAREKVLFVILFLVALVLGFTLLWAGGYMRSIAGKFISVLDPFLRGSLPLLESVAEHRISAWGSIYFDVGIGIIFFLAGLFFVIRDANDKNLFLLLFGLTALYFGSSMVRVLVVFGEAFSILAAIGIVGVLRPFFTLLREPARLVSKRKYGLEHVGKEFSAVAVFMIFLILMTNLAFSPQSSGVPNVYVQAYAPETVTAGSLPIAPSVPVKEWLDMFVWTQNNLQSTTVVCAWWDYGYWLTTMGNVTTLSDNGTENSTQIENVAFAFMANETQSLQMLKRYNAEYILVFTTLTFNSSGYAVWAGYGDEGKWIWMARISGEARDRFINDKSLGLDANSAWTDETKFGNYSGATWVWNDQGRNSTIYKLMSWGKQRWCDTNGVSPDVAGVKPQYFEEVYFTGLTLSPSNSYGGIIPLVCLYKIDYPSQ